MTYPDFLDLFCGAARWARPAHSGNAIVVFFPGTLPYGVGCEFLCHGLQCTAGMWYGVGSSAGRAVKIAGSPSVLSDILERVPPPKARGSATAGNLLPW